MEFTGGVYTTSRGESMNSLIKRYIDSSSEMVDLIKFLNDYEHKYYLREEKVKTNLTQQDEKHPLLVCLQNLCGIIYKKILEQFYFWNYYFLKVHNEGLAKKIL